MKTNHIIKNMAALALLATLNSQLSTAFAQGSLTPPGSPAPTMKTADQIEPRTPISSAPYTITNSGSYYLTTNLTGYGDAITIATNGVTLDLNGFTIYSSYNWGATGSGILLKSGLSDITIINGHICGGITNNGSGVYSGNGFGYGILYLGNPPANVVVSKVSVAGVYVDGINVGTGNATVVDACTVTTVGFHGITASIIKSSVATDCGYDAIDGDQVIDCRGISTGGANGISASATAQNCYGKSSIGIGLVSSIAIGCIGYSTSGIGLQATIANSCIIGSGTTNVTYHCNMPW